MAGFRTRTRQIVPGDRVAAGITNRMPQDGFDNTLYLKALIDAAQIGSAIFARNVRIETDAKVGMPVYYRPENSQFERGLAAVVNDPNLSTLVMAPSANIWGVVYKKCAPDAADILLSGFAPLDLTEAIDEPLEAAVYYLSSVEPGKLTTMRPPVGIPILRADGQGNVLVNPQWRDIIEDHIHYKFDLLVAPAGDHNLPSPGGVHTIPNPDPAREGWLPADHPVFDGNAPAGAAFGYNLQINTSLNSVWPPLPISGASLVWTWGDDLQLGGMEVPLGVETGLAVIDENGIWWMSNCYGDVPWPTDWTPGTSASVGVGPLECPRFLYMSLTLYFLRAVLASNKTVVTSLRAAEGSRLTVRCFPEGTPDTVGDLEIDLDLDFVAGNNDEPGHLVLKDLDENTFKRGPIVEWIKAGSNRVVMSSTAPANEDPDDPGSPIVHQGRITLDVDVDPGSKELLTQLVRLDGASEEFPFDVHAIGFKANKTALFRGKLNVPSEGLPLNPQLRIRLRIMGRSGGTLPSLDLAMRRIPATVVPPYPSATPLAIPLVDTAVPIDTVVSISPNEYIDALSDPLSVAAGDVVIFEVKRNAGDTYVAEVDVLSHVGVLEAGP